jgi:pantothenate kinase
MESIVNTLAEALVTKASSDGAQYWVGVAGAPGSGKTTLVSALAAVLGRSGVSCTVVPMDGYHYSRMELDAMPDPGSAHRFRGAPFTFNADAFVGDLRLARKDRAFSFPGFDHSVKDPVPDTHVLKRTSRVVLVEGNYLLLDEDPWRALSEPGLFDEMWYLRCPLEVAKQRLAKRHMHAWGWTMQQAMERIEDSDGKNMALVIGASAGIARANRVVDVAVPWND